MINLMRYSFGDDRGFHYLHAGCFLRTCNFPFRHCTSCPASPPAARLVLWHFLGGGRGRICPKWFWSERRAASRRWRPGRFYRSVRFPSISNQENNFKSAVVFFFLWLCLMRYKITSDYEMWHKLTFKEMVEIREVKLLVLQDDAEKQKTHNYSSSLKR